MPIGIESKNANETARREGLINRWHRVAHVVLVFPGIALAYFLGTMSNGQFSVMTILMVIVGLEVLSLLIAFIGSKAPANS